MKGNRSIDPMTARIINYIAVFFIVCCVSISALAANRMYAHYFLWETYDGQTAITDDEKRIPEAAKIKPDSIVERTEKDLKPFVNNKKYTITSEEYRKRLNTRLKHLRGISDSPDVKIQCEGVFKVIKERRDREFNGQKLNSLFYVILDSCGNEVSATLTNPVPYIKVETR